MLNARKDIVIGFFSLPSVRLLLRRLFLFFFPFHPVLRYPRMTTGRGIPGFNDVLHNSSTRRFKRTWNKRAATVRNTRTTFTVTERDKVRDALSLGKQAAIGTRGSSVLPHGYNLSGRDIYL
ncbi:hypothetical protein CEXT_499861 [Caerostris extrusa]|uniref:Uncharacterized protein n=1 Tax=Caerostris extrusa TaxID=172846 RepID=A0AAV4MV62_CAEEX|nr:hypothetical protein CEXT_499861 [Caerostris extrusa]